MPFCTHCGGTVKPNDIYCARCGAQQREAATPAADPTGPSPDPGAGATPPPKSSNPFDSLTPANAAVLCYVPWLGWIASIVVLATERFRPDKIVRFHAFQGLYLFVLWLFVSWVFSPIAEYAQATRAIGSLMKLGVLGVWIFMLVKTSQKELVKLPLLGELADRSVAEQR
jgi:uncharacterized membrane protein